MTTVKPTLSIDFDGVCNPYSQGWQNGDIYDRHPTTGTLPALQELAERYRLVISTARTDLKAVEKKLEEWGLSPHIAEVTNTKPPAVAYVDDKALLFKGWSQTIDELKKREGKQ